MEDIKTSTIRVPKYILEEIKIYCRKSGKPVGEWVETAWNFIEKNDFDIYDNDATPFLPLPAEIEKERNQVDVLCKLMTEFITAQKQTMLPTHDLIAHTVEEKAKAEYKNQEQEKEIKLLQEELARLRNEIKDLEHWKDTAGKELIRCKGVFSSANSKTMKDLGLE